MWTDRRDITLSVLQTACTGEPRKAAHKWTDRRDITLSVIQTACTGEPRKAAQMD